MRRTPLRAAAVTIGGLALVAGPLVAPASAAVHEIQLIGINDFHGRLEPVGSTDDDQPIGGAAQLAGAIDALSAGNPDTFFVSNGDNIGASTFTSNVQQDAPTIEALNAMGLVASSVGNHEFDRGFDDIAIGGRVDTLADFPYLGANVYAAGTEDPVLQESATVTTDGGVEIAFIGVVTEETASLVAPDGIADITFGNEAEAVNRVAAELEASASPPDIIVALSHSGSSDADCGVVAGTPLVAGADGSIDVILQGHTHTEYACNDVSGAGGFSGPVVQSGQYGEAFGVVEITYDDVTDVVDATARVEALVGYAATNEAVNQIVADAVAFAAAEGAEPLGEITADITRAFDGETENRGAESDLGNFIATVQLDQTQAAGAQIAFMNPGGLRDDFLVDDIFGDEAPGVVTLGEANAVQPFANGVVTMTLTGQQIKDVLEEQWQPDGSSRPFLALGVSEGFLYSFDESAPRGQRITGASLNGEVLDLGATYRVTVNSFLASGGDNFGTLAEGTDRQELGVTDLEALQAFLAENSPVTADTESNRVAEPIGFIGDGPPPVRDIQAACMGVNGAGFPDTGSLPEEFQAAIECLSAYEFSEGFADGTFRSGEDVQRYHMTLFLHRALEYIAANSGGQVTLPAGGETSFGDIDGLSAESQTAIATLVGIDVVMGKNATTFDPFASITRRDTASLIIRLQAYVAAELGSPDAAYESLGGDLFPDVPASLPRAEDINALVWAGIAQGGTDGNYLPYDAVTRGEMALFVMRYLDENVASDRVQPLA